MTAVIYHNETGETHEPHKFYDTLGGAKRALTALKKRAAKNPGVHDYVLQEADNFIAASVDDWLMSHAWAYSQELVEVRNIISGDGKKPIWIKRCDVGGPCDPSTERYHTM